MTRRTAAVVLAGGQARRFGEDKALALYRGKPLIDWSIAALEPHAELLLVSGHDHPQHPVVADLPEAGIGPLGGLAGALSFAADRGFSHLLSAPCDTPRIPPALLTELARSKGACYAESCPVIGCWPTDLAPALIAYLAHDMPRAVRRWAEHVGAAAIGGYPAIENINHVADLAELARRDG